MLHSRSLTTAHYRLHLIIGGIPIVLLAFLPSVCHGADVQFNSHIRPILSENCLQCHGPDPDKREADLRLDIEELAKESAISPMQPNRSELFIRLVTDDADLRMPPPETGKSLSATQIDLVRQWILDGAKYEGHWAFEQIRKTEPPQSKEAVLTDIDRFITAALTKRGLVQAPAVSRQQLIRRATFDLTGLPPKWEDVVEFVNDPSPRAFEGVVDRLLNSPRYGERWGRHWLDIARYADTFGGSAIGFTKFPFSYTYRDYVIHAFNADLPYDQFVTEQLAADQLELKDNDPALAAMGFLTVGLQYRNRHDVIDDQIDVVTRGLLGLTAACARCHDHKYDTIPTEDYYALYATLASSRSPQLLPEIGQTIDSKPYLTYQHELALLQTLHDDMAREQSAIMRGRLRMQVGAYLRELAKGSPEQDLSNTFLSYRTDDLRPLVLNRWREYVADLPDEDPVFGPWRQLSRMDSDSFAVRCDELIHSLIQQNGVPDKQPELHQLISDTLRWNSRILNVIAEKKPKSLLEVADIYGELFAKVHQQWLKELLGTSHEASAEGTVVPDEDLRHLEVNSPVNRQLRRYLYASGTPTAMPDEIAVKLLNRPIHDNVVGRKKKIHDLHLNSPGSPPRAMALRENKDSGEFQVFLRGNPIERGKPIQPRFLTILSGTQEKTFAAGKRRLGLAQAIVDPINPLTRRVIVNWVWQRHFGRGLVRTPDDFGTRGLPPTHPRLLDYLAATLLEDGWSLKKLHRRIMLTAVYQQAPIEHAESRIKDPENELLWRMPRRRLEMEVMRDAMLAVSGELEAKIGGRPFDLLSNPVVPRRTIYAFVNRDIVSSMASTFDVADPSACTATRPETNVPQQTLFALNSPFIQDRATQMASRKDLAAASSDEERIQLLYQLSFSRSPEPSELQVALHYIRSQGEKSKTIIWQRLAHALLATNEFIYVD
ncbi:MAG: PSD1 and planctomycete cytochrome C domain-containing protein [Pirellulales bacterium]